MMLYFIKVALLMTVLLIIYKLFLSKINAFKFNRFYLLFSLMLSLVVPLIVLPTIFPETQKVHAQLERIFDFEEKGNTSSIDEDISAISPSSHAIENDGEISIQSKSESNLNYATIFFSIYIIGVIFIGIVFISKLIGFFKLVKSSVTENKDDFSYVLIEKETLPFVFLNYFFINKEVFQSNQIAVLNRRPIRNRIGIRNPNLDDICSTSLNCFHHTTRFSLHTGSRIKRQTQCTKQENCSTKPCCYSW